MNPDDNSASTSRSGSTAQRRDLVIAFWGDPISAYARQQPIGDGVLVEVSTWARWSGPNGMLGGFSVSVAVVTGGLWDFVHLDAH